MLGHYCQLLISEGLENSKNKAGLLIGEKLGGKDGEDKAVCVHGVFSEFGDFLFFRTSLPFLYSFLTHSGYYYYYHYLSNVLSAYSYRRCAKCSMYAEPYKVLIISIYVTQENYRTQGG